MVKESSKRIAKNTAMLYFRMLLTMIVSLYTSRIVLSTLGVEDFGVYNIVGSIVAMSAIITNTFTGAIQRFLSFEIGANNPEKLKKVFSISLTLQLLIAVLIFVLAETIGLWMLNTKLVIPPERMDAARWVFQFSVLSFIIATIQAPFNASLIAHENMKVYAYVSILEVTLKLLLVFLLTRLHYDKLVMYAVLMFSVSFLIAAIYRFYSRSKYQECRFAFSWDKKLFKSMLEYSGWNLYGSLSMIALDQGINILINLFFGPALNAARGIAMNVRTAVYGFFYNFQLSVNPQIIKAYASNEKEHMMKLVFQSSKFSFFLLFFIVSPILIETPYLLDLWLVKTPDHAILFCQLILINTLIECLSGPLGTAASATSKIKGFQLIIGTLMLLGFPMAWIALSLGYSAESTVVVLIIVSCLSFVARLFVLKGLIGLPIRSFLDKIIVPILLVVILFCILPLATLSTMPSGLPRFLLNGFLSVILNSSTIYIFGLNKEERDFLIKSLKQKLLRNKEINPPH